ncbi:MAG TPA: hypothetical protein VFQ26_08525 [Nitrospiraceae bacterium]|nr:hypothetical protein [Nitrospiraceae bacterium]
MPPVRNSVWSAYESLVDALEEASAQANCGVVKKSRPLYSCFSLATPTEAKFECYLHLKEWNYRAGSSKRPIHILLHAQEQIRRSDDVLLRSSVRVSYFRVQDNLAHLLQNIHFDYAPNRPAHPLFHAQVNNEALHPPSSQSENLEFQFDIQPSVQPWFNHARIPTSDMSFPSVLLCLAADHFEAQFFHEFYKKVCAEQAKMPHPPFELLRHRLSCMPLHFRSSQWFDPPII